MLCFLAPLLLRTFASSHLCLFAPLPLCSKNSTIRLTHYKKEKTSCFSFVSLWCEFRLEHTRAGNPTLWRAAFGLAGTGVAPLWAAQNRPPARLSPAQPAAQRGAGTSGLSPLAGCTRSHGQGQSAPSHLRSAKRPAPQPGPHSLDFAHSPHPAMESPSPLLARCGPLREPGRDTRTPGLGS